MKKLAFVIIFLLLVGNVFGETYDFTSKATVEWYIKIPFMGKIKIYSKKFTISNSISVGESKTFKKEILKLHIPIIDIDINLITFTTTVSAKQINENIVKITMVECMSGIFCNRYICHVTYGGTVNGKSPDENHGNTLIWYFTVNNQENNNQDNLNDENINKNNNNQQTTTKTPIPPLAIVLTLIVIPIIALRKFIVLFKSE